jgi:DNA-binding transcriptional LysR family regulator
VRNHGHVAIKNFEHRVQLLNTGRARLCVDALDWDDLKVFLDVAYLGSFRAAADAGKVSVNTVRARIAKLEAAYGAPLFRRSREGSAVTEAGRELLAVAREMQQAAHMPMRPTAGNVLLTPGQIRVFCSEGLGLLWLTPRLEGLSDVLDDVTVSLAIDYDLSRDRSREVDVALTFRRPDDPEMIITRLATLHYMLFASPAYLRQYGTPRSLHEVMNHKLVEQTTPGVNTGVLDFILGPDHPEGLVPIRTNSSLAQLWAVANGAGIAAMPTYVRAITRSVIPINPPLNLRFDLFCTYHGNARGSPAIETTVAWLRRCFDPQAYPWFRNEFVHPDDFAMGGKGEVVSLFDNLIEPAGRRRA